jgi:hypothetical protein
MFPQDPFDSVEVINGKLIDHKREQRMAEERARCKVTCIQWFVGLTFVSSASSVAILVWLNLEAFKKIL